MSMKTRLENLVLPLFFAIFCISGVVHADSVENIATTCARDLGKVTKNYNGKSGQVIIFEEDHSLLNARIEIAHMLLRLYKNAGLRNIGLEGAFASEKITPTWAQPLSAKNRLRVSAQLLGDGELNSAEFMALAFSNIVVTGIDDKDYYKQKLNKKQAISSYMYLMLIAEKSFSPPMHQKADDLLNENKIKEAFDFIIDTDPWTKKMSAQLNPSSKDASAEQILQYLQEIKQESEKRQVEIPDDVKRDMNAKIAFIEAVIARSKIMASNAISLTESDHKAPIAIIIGAAHTEHMADLLKQKSVTFSVIRPNALDINGANNSAIDYERYERKSQGRSVDVNGLGSLLDKKRNTRPVISMPWLVEKANIYEVTSQVVEGVIINQDRPPYKFSLPTGYFVNPDEITKIGDEILFPVEFDNIVENKNSKKIIWVRAANSSNILQNSNEQNNINKRIDSLLREAEVSEGNGGNKEPPKDESNADFKDPTNRGKEPRETSKRITEGIYAKFAENRHELEKESVLIDQRF